jgi:hypothetical protein
MKLLKSTAPKPREATDVRKTRTSVKPVSRSQHSQQESEQVQMFRKVVRKRPSSEAWLIHYGRLGRDLGLTYPETFLVVKAQVRRLRGNIRLKWVHRGLRQGYDHAGLAA